MKFHVLIFLVCVVQVSLGFPEDKSETSNDLKNMLLEAKIQTEELESYASSTAKNLKNLFNLGEKNVPEQIENIKSDIWMKLQSDIKELKKEGNEAKACLETASGNLEAIFENAEKEIRTCQFETFFYGFTPVYINANLTKAMGDDLVKHFETIIKRCESFDGERCLTRNTPEAKILFENLKDSINKIKKLIEQTESELTKEASTCLSKKLDSLSATSQIFIEEAVKCISDL